MVGALLTLLAVQQAQIAIAVDRDTVRVGEDVIVTITVQSPGDQSVELVDPTLRGLELRNATNQSRFQMQGDVGLRTTTRTLTLRALAAGVATIGPVIARQGPSSASTSAVTILVEAAIPAGVRELEPRIVRLLSSMEPAVPSPEEVALTVFTVPDRVTLGEQVDVIISAWVPRDIRTRLRNPPALESPQVRGAWAYRQPTPLGIAMSREVGGITYDVFVQHEVIFPLTAGAATIGAAKVSYSLPLSYSFLSRELRHEVQSPPVTIDVAPFPPADPDMGFNGAAGAGLVLELEASSAELPIGSAVMVRAEVRGNGNVALWPEPDFQWPSGLRAYPQGVDVRLADEPGPIGGFKVFNYLLIADSVGTHRVHVPAYVYYDVAEAEYRTLSGSSLQFTTPGTRGIATGRGQGVPALISVSRVPRADELVAQMPGWGWVLLVILPPLLAAAVRWRPAIRPRRTARKKRRDASDPHAWDVTFRRTLASLIPHAAERSGAELAEALRAAGVDAPLAAHAARLRDRLSRAVYGPDDSADPEELLEEIREVIAALTTEDDPAARRGLVVAALLCALFPVTGQAQAPEALYGAGAMRAAAESLSARAAAAPEVAEHWHNLGNALSGMGEPVRARVAWIRAARLAPRHATVRRPVRDATSGGVVPRPGRVWVSPITAAEAFILAVAFWSVGWVLVMLRRRRRYWLPMIVAGVVFAAVGVGVYDRYAEPLGLVLVVDSGLRAAPYGPADIAVRLAAGTPVRVEREADGWMLVRVGGDRGWMRRVEVVKI